MYYSLTLDVPQYSNVKLCLAIIATYRHLKNIRFPTWRQYADALFLEYFRRWEKGELN